MKIRDLGNVREVVEAIGRERVRTITGKGNTNVSNWITRNRFPPETFHLLQTEIERIHCRASPRLWRMMMPRARAA